MLPRARAQRLVVEEGGGAIAVDQQALVCWSA
jgi:hypothetical protein